MKSAWILLLISGICRTLCSRFDSETTIVVVIWIEIQGGDAPTLAPPSTLSVMPLISGRLDQNSHHCQNLSHTPAVLPRYGNATTDPPKPLTTRYLNSVLASGGSGKANSSTRSEYNVTSLLSAMSSQGRIGLSAPVIIPPIENVAPSWPSSDALQTYTLALLLILVARLIQNTAML